MSAAILIAACSVSVVGCALLLRELDAGRRPSLLGFSVGALRLACRVNARIGHALG